MELRIARPAIVCAALVTAALSVGCNGKSQTRQDCADYQTCVNMAATARDRGDYTTANTFYTRACDVDNQGCVELGSFNEFYVLDPVAAEAAYKRGCDAGYATACFHLGMFFEENIWAPNYARAQQAYQLACQLDYNYCSY